MESGEKLQAENARLNAENERQTAEMVSMKKKIKLAMKKQQAELLAKIQAAEERAVAAEAAVAVLAGSSITVSEADAQIREPPGPANGTDGASSSSLFSLVGTDEVILVSPLAQHAYGFSMNSQASVDKLEVEHAGERQRSQEPEDDALKERQRLENEVVELRKTTDAALRQKDEARTNFEEELKLLKEGAELRVGQLMKANEKLEAQLLGAAGQVADAFTRMSATHDDMERISKEAFKAKRAHSNLSIEHESVCHELERYRAALAEAQQHLLDKSKEMEEKEAARRSAQEGQEAAMSQLMHRLDEMEAAGTGQQAEHLRELNEDKVHSLLQENADLLKELEQSREAISVLREELSENKNLLLALETAPKSADSICRGLVEKRIADMKAEHEQVIEGLKSQTYSLRQEVQQLHKADQQAIPSTFKELSLLREQLEESRAGLQGAQNQIKCLSGACDKAENQVLKVTQEVGDAHKNQEDEIKLRDDKYAELDAKFGRLQKRAKQRIQEVQKEKEELESQVAASTEKVAEALSKQAALQDDLERVRHQTGEALRAWDAERRQLRVTCMKVTEEAEDLRRTLAESRRLASEKDQTALKLTATLKEAKANHESVLLDLKEKHRKVEENFSAQYAYATSESKKMAETIFALQDQAGVKESKLAELEAATSGEMVRLGASLEAAKGEVSRLEFDSKREQEQWQASFETLRRKLEEAEEAIQNQTIAAKEVKSQLESELERQRQVFRITQADVSVARQEKSRVVSDFAAYKVRANAVLQKKEAELLAAKNSCLTATQEKDLKKAQQEGMVLVMERDGAFKALQDSVSDYESKLAARDISVKDAQQLIRDLATKLEASKRQLLVEQEKWQNQIHRMETTWRLKCDTLDAKANGSVEANLKNEYAALMTEYNNLKTEFETFRDLVDTVIEEKDKEIASLLEENSAFQRSAASLPQVRNDIMGNQADNVPNLEPGVVQVAEQQILILARQQAQREEEVSQCRRHIQALQEEITDLEYENRLHSQQEALLKEELRNLERAHKRGGVDMTYLKNVILKLLETGEVEALLPVVAMLLQFSPDELKRCHDTYHNVAGSTVPLGSAAGVVDTSVSTPRTFFPRLKFAGGG